MWPIITSMELILISISAATLGASAAEPSDYGPVADRLIDYLLSGEGRGVAYQRLVELSDGFGHRMVGSKALDEAVDYLVDEMRREGLDNVHKEPVKDLPRWVRGEETAFVTKPRRRDMRILGLGGTVPTPPRGLCARALVVESFDELSALGDRVAGKIVVYNQPWNGYGRSVVYRSQGASEASKLGAVAVLIRSVTPHSVYSLHTGTMNYRKDVKPIPAASLTVEDASMLHRLYQRNLPLKICINITSHPDGTVDSYNTVAEITGSTYPNEIVMIGGHLDSWDVGSGAMDDGGGVMITWMALSAIRALGLKPKRTIRAVFWTAEEQGYLGCAYYYARHKAKRPEEIFRFVFETDAGAFKPDGLNFNGTAKAQATMQKVMNLLKRINATNLYPAPEVGDVELWKRDGVPAALLETKSKNDYYFTYHHTRADDPTIFRPSDLDYASALTTVVAFVIADMEPPL